MLTIEFWNDSKVSNSLLHHLINQSIESVPNDLVKVEEKDSTSTVGNGRIKIVIGDKNSALDINILANIASVDEE